MSSDAIKRDHGEDRHVVGNYIQSNFVFSKISKCVKVLFFTAKFFLVINVGNEIYKTQAQGEIILTEIHDAKINL